MASGLGWSCMDAPGRFYVERPMRQNRDLIFMGTLLLVMLGLRFCEAGPTTFSNDKITLTQEPVETKPLKPPIIPDAEKERERIEREYLANLVKLIAEAFRAEMKAVKDAAVEVAEKAWWAGLAVGIGGASLVWGLVWLGTTNMRRPA